MRLRALALGALGTLGFGLLGVAPAHALDTIDFAFQTPPPLTQARSATDVNSHVTSDVTGTYTLQWSLKGNGPFDPVVTSGQATGTLLPGGEVPAFPISAPGQPDGTYEILGSITVEDPVRGEVTGQALGSMEIHRVFTFDNGTSDDATIYPLVNTDQHPGYTAIRFTSPIGDCSTMNTIEISDAGGTLLSTLSPTTSSDCKRLYLYFSGGSTSSPMAPGTYTATAVDEWGNRSVHNASVTVSAKKLVARRASATFTARAGLVDRFVGKCSSLRTPATGRGRGSLGLYANTRCKKKTWAASGISAVFGVVLPTAETYSGIQVTIGGGAARAKRGSRAAFEYYSKNSRWIAGQTLTKAFTNHVTKGQLINTVLRDGNSVYWRVATGFGYRYDVTTVTVVVTYKVIV